MLVHSFPAHLIVKVNLNKIFIYYIMNNFNNIIAILVLLILIPFIFRLELREFFNPIVFEEIIDEETNLKPNFELNNSNSNNLHLTATSNYLDNYKEIITNNTDIIDSSINNLVKSRNNVYLKGKPMSSFDNLNYNRALIDSLKLQNLEDRYIYKLNHKIQ